MAGELDGSGWYCNGCGSTWQQEPVQSADANASHDNRSDVQKTGSVRSIIINPLLYDLTCENTEGLGFVLSDLAVSPSCGSKCGCNAAEQEFAEQEVATVALMSQGFRKVKWLTWVVCWQGVATAVLMSHSFVV